MEGNWSRGLGTVRSGILTGLSTAVVSGSAAVAGIILSRKFGHGVKTDGFFAANNAYVAVVLLMSVIRVVALPRLVRAAGERRLPGEVGAWLAAVSLPLAPVLVVALVWPAGLADALTSDPGSRHWAAQLLPWVVASAVAQVYGGIVASALATDDDYATAAFGFGAGSVVGLVATVLLLGHGLIAFGWGLALNGAVSLGVPLLVLVRRRGVGRPDRAVAGRLVEFGEGVALPLALQGLYLIASRFASGVGPGAQTTFSYAYLIAALFVQLTATSIALVSTVPFARSGATPERTARHVVSASWLSLAPIAAGAAVFALAGQQLARHVLGPHYGGGTGAELGRLVVYLAPWTVASVALTVTYPLLLVRGRARWLPALAVAALLLHVPLEWAGRAAFGLGGVAGALAVSTAAILVALLAGLDAVERTARGVLAAAAICGGLAALVFGLPHLAVGALPAAALGLVLYAAALAIWRPAGLRSAWAYVRALQ